MFIICLYIRLVGFLFCFFSIQFNNSLFFRFCFICSNCFFLFCFGGSLLLRLRFHVFNDFLSFICSCIIGDLLFSSCFFVSSVLCFSFGFFLGFVLFFLSFIFGILFGLCCRCFLRIRFNNSLFFRFRFICSNCFLLYCFGHSLLF